MLEAFVLVWLGVISAQIAPGPNLVAVASVALAEGRSKSLMVVLGVATGMFVWSAATALGLARLLELFPMSLNAMRILGGGYLIWLAFRAIRSAISGGEHTISADRKHLTPLTAWRRGLFVVLTNPKAALMWVAVATYLFGAGLSAGQVLMFGPLGALSGLIVYGLYAALFSTSVAARFYSQFARRFEVVFAGAFGALGGKLIYDGLRELRA